MTPASEFKFKSPPIFEVGLAVMTAAPAIDPYYIREIHDLFRSQFPRYERQPAFPGLQPFPSAGAPQMHHFMMTPMMGPMMDASRFWFLDAGGNNLTQVQPNFFARNWRRLSLGDQNLIPYPGYETLSAEFKALIAKLGKWTAEHGGRLPEPAMCELLYDNMIPLIASDGTEIKASDVLETLKAGTTAATEYVNQWFERIDSDDFNKPTDFQVAIRGVGAIVDNPTPTPFIKLTFVARSAVQSWSGVYDFFDRAHLHVRKRLIELTTAAAREAWST